MKKSALTLVALFTLSGCATTLSEEDPAAYEASLDSAKVILKSNQALNKYKKYYNFPGHKAFAQSKVNGTGGYSVNNTSKEYAIEVALELCHQRLLKRYEEITDSVSCEIVNVDNEWVTK